MVKQFLIFCLSLVISVVISVIFFLIISFIFGGINYLFTRNDANPEMPLGPLYISAITSVVAFFVILYKTYKYLSKVYD
jgi:hypothetical protein